MAITVPETRLALAEGDVVTSESVRAVTWVDAARLANWIAGRPVVHVPAHRPGSMQTDVERRLRYRVHLRYQDVRLAVRFSLSATTTNGRDVTVECCGASATMSVLARPRTTAPAEHEVLLDLPSRWAGEVEVFVSVGGGDESIVVESLSISTVPRTVLDDDAHDLGIDRLRFWPRQPITSADLGKIAARVNERRDAARRASIYQWSADSAENGPRAFTSGTYTALATYDFPLQGRYLYSGDTARTVAWRVIAYCSDATTSANVRISDGSGALSTIAIPTGSDLKARPRAWPTTGGAPATFSVDAVDPTEADGLRGSAWDDHTIEVQRTAGSGTVYIVGVSIGEWPDVWMPYDLSDLTLWVRGDEDSVQPVSADAFTWHNHGSAAGTMAVALTGRAPVLDTINGRASVSFDATNDVLTSTLTLGDLTSSAIWISGVIRADALTTAFNASSPQSGHGLFHTFAGHFGVMACTTGLYVYADEGGGSYVYTDRVAISTGEAVYFEAMFDDATSSLFLRVNGGALTPGGIDPGSLTLTSTLRIGNGGSAAAFDHAIGELVACSSIPSSDDLAAWRSYVAARWGVTTP